MIADRCPGVLRPHLAADGAMVRVRLPGGRTTGSALRELSRIAVAYGSGVLQLTSRAGLQLRGLPTEVPAEVEQAITTAGFLPSASHERVRNVACSPLTGLAGGHADLRPLLWALDAAIQAEPELVRLSGRFLFALDDGRGDQAALEPDLTYRATDATHGLILVADRAVEVTTVHAVPGLIALARSFAAAAAGTGAWRIADLPSWLPPLPGVRPVPVLPTPAPTPLGRIGEHASVAVPLGLLTPEQVAAVDRVTRAGDVVITPQRGLVLASAADRLSDLLAAGLVSDDQSAGAAVSACVGAPWCARGRVDTRALVGSVAALGGPWRRTHISGCERRCGAPRTAYVDLVAPTRGELVAAAHG